MPLSPHKAANKSWGQIHVSGDSDISWVVKLKHFTPPAIFLLICWTHSRIFAELMESEPDTRCICCCLAAVSSGQGRGGQIFLSARFLTSCRLQSYIIHTNLRIWQAAKVLSSQAFSEFLFLIWQSHWPSLKNILVNCHFAFEMLTSFQICPLRFYRVSFVAQ